MGFALQWRKVRHLLTGEPTANASVSSDLGVMGEAVSQRQRVDLSLLVQQGPTVISCPMRFVDMTVEIL